MPPYDEEMASYTPNAASTAAEPVPEVAGFFDQFGAAMKKNFIQKRQRMGTCLLETLLPPIFVLGLIGIWAATNPVDNDGRDFANYTAMGQLLPLQRLSEIVPQVACTSTNQSHALLPHLKTCDELLSDFAAGNALAVARRSMAALQAPGESSPEFFSEPRCFGRDDLIDVDDFCLFVDPSALIAPYAFNYDTPREIGSIDDAILAKWLGLLAFPDRPERGGSQSNLGALRREGLVAFSPDTPEVRAMVDYFNSTSRYFSFVFNQIFESYDAMDAFARDVDLSESKNWIGIHIDEMTSDTLEFRMRVNRSVSLTEFVTAFFYSGGVEDRPRWYHTSGFMSFQRAVTEYHISQIKGEPLPPQPVLVTMGYVPWTQQVFLQIAGGLAPLMLVLSFLYPVSQLVKGVVLEKETRIREAMMIMGLGSGSFYLSWFMTYALQYLISSILCAFLLRISFIPQSNVLIVFFCFYFFCLSSIALAMMVASLFSKARLASLLSPVIYFILSMPLFAVDNLPPAGQGVLMLLSPSAFAGGLQLIFNYEMGTGLGDKELASKADDIPMIAILFFLALDTILYILLTLYFDAIIPSEWGTKKHPLFCIIDPIKWIIGGKGAASGEGITADDRDANGFFEDCTSTNPITVRIRGLRKEFVRGERKFLAVDNLHLDMRENEINVLLGHNGAGKSTTMNMMTGMIGTDGGDCEIYGHSVVREKAMVHRMIGYCPQHNILWPELTCYQHLDFFARIKGVPSEQRDGEIRRMLQAVDLGDKVTYLASALSGGQKRKLSVAIAFIGGSKLVFLDEPSAGVDLQARRFMWDLIKAMTPGRTILLTTHFLDEADLLGNTISIMSKGRLKCSGTSLYLKSRLGVGYSLNMSVDPTRDHKALAQLVLSNVDDATALPSGSGEVVYRLPTHATPQFPQLLEGLEENSAALGVRGFGITVTTLEEVFIKIAEEEEVDDSASPKVVRASPAPSSVSDPATAPPSSPSSPSNGALAVEIANKQEELWRIQQEQRELSAMTLYVIQFKANLAKRFHNAKRDRRTQCLQIIVPVICVLLSMLFTLLVFVRTDPLEIDPKMYEKDGIDTQDFETANCGSLLSAEQWDRRLDHRAISNMSDGSAFSAHLVDTFKQHGGWRFNAMFCSDSIAASITGHPTSMLFYNTTGYHVLPDITNQYYRNYLRTISNAAPSDPNTVDVRLTVHPWSLTNREDALFSSIRTILIGIIIMIPFTFIPSTFVSWIVKERECKAKHLQTSSGLNFFVYWTSNFVFDLLSFVVTVGLVFIVFLMFNRTEYIGTGENFGATFLLFIFYGLAGISGSYLVSFLFDEHSQAQNVVMLSNFISGFLLVLVIFILQDLGGKTEDVANVLRFFCRLIPSYCLGEGIINMALADLFSAFNVERGRFDMDVTGWPILFMALEFPIFMIATFLIDHPSRRMRQQQLLHDPNAKPEVIPNEDPDVAAERQLVEGADPSRADDMVVVRQLSKRYPNGKLAVRNLSFGIKRGEVFGFLGTNGCGKSSTLGVLSGDHMPTTGRCYVAGFDVVADALSAQRNVGYCPQFDALLDLLTVHEHLLLYSRIRGLDARSTNIVVDTLMEIVGLRIYRDVVSSALSGGNKRKLSVALALIGGPRVVFLDEPSAGVDPQARRGLFDVIQHLSAHCAVVLTTHHLEEVEALAHRVAIMVDGALHCIGDKTHLKNKFGSGFEMIVRLEAEDHVAPFEAFVQTTMPNAKQIEKRGTKLTYGLPRDAKLSKAFRVIEESRVQHHISDYSISQASLEQVFLRIAEADAEGEHFAAAPAVPAENDNRGPSRQPQVGEWREPPRNVMEQPAPVPEHYLLPQRHASRQ